MKEFINDVNVSQQGWQLDDPYYYVRIDAIDHSEIDFVNFTTFTPSDVTQSYKASENEYFTWIGPGNGVSSITFTRSFNFSVTGKYLVELIIWNKQTVANADNCDISIGGTSIYTFNGHQAWNDYGKIIRAPICDVTAGNHDVTVTVPANCMVGWIRISKLTRFEGGREYNGPSDTRLDLIDISFSQNGIVEIDKLNIKVAMKDDYWEFNGFNLLKFDLGDHVTVALGETMDETVPMFGGYVEGWDISDDGTELTLQCVSRMWDLKRTHILKNFKLGGTKVGQDGAIQPYRSFGSIQEAARYLCTSLYDIDYNAISRDYAYFNNFSDASDVTGLTSVGFDTRWETNFGTNGSSLTIRPTKPGVNSLILFDNADGSQWDATVYDQFEFDYYVSGAGVKYPIKFNIEIDMFMTNQTPADALTYVVKFNGPTSTSTRILTTITPKFNGTWQEVSLNLKKLFNGKAPVSYSVTEPSKANYYITQIRLVGQQDNMTVLDRRCSSLTIDNIIGFRTFDKFIKYSSTDVPTAYDELEEICNKSNYMAWIRPGMERRDDQLILLPKYFYTLPIQLTPYNIRELKNLSYHPIENGMINYVRGIFAYDDYRTGTVTQADAISIKNYLPIGETDVLSGLSSIEAANNQLSKRLEKAKWDMEKLYGKDKVLRPYKDYTSAPMKYSNYTKQELVNIDSQVDYLLKQNISSAQLSNLGCDVTINGSTLLEPGQLAIVIYPAKRIEGLFTVESIEHRLDCVSNIFTTDLNLNIPSKTFSNYKVMLDKLERKLKTLENNAAYHSSGALVGGMETSNGAYS